MHRPGSEGQAHLLTPPWPGGCSDPPMMSRSVRSGWGVAGRQRALPLPRGLVAPSYREPDPLAHPHHGRWLSRLKCPSHKRLMRSEHTCIPPGPFV